MVRVDPEDVARAKAGDREAAGRVVVGIRPLVVQIATGYGKRTPGVEIDDLIQEGCLAVLSACRYFRRELGFEFSTYAADCIRKRMVGWLRDPRYGPVEGLEQVEDPDETNADGVAGAVLDPSSDEPANPDADRQRAVDLLGKLDIISRTIVQLRHGYDGHDLTFQGISDRLGLGLGSVQRLYEQALATMRGDGPAPSN